MGALVHDGAGAAALHPAPDLTAGRHHGLVGRLAADRSGLPVTATGETTQPLHDWQPTLTRHLQRLRRHSMRTPTHHALTTSGNKPPHSRIGGSRLRLRPFGVLDYGLAAEHAPIHRTGRGRHRHPQPQHRAARHPDQAARPPRAAPDRGCRQRLHRRDLRAGPRQLPRRPAGRTAAQPGRGGPHRRGPPGPQPLCRLQRRRLLVGPGRPQSGRRAAWLARCSPWSARPICCTRRSEASCCPVLGM